MDIDNNAVMDMTEASSEARNELAERLQTLGYGLQRKIDERAVKKQTLEERWVKDLMRFHGKNSETEKQNLADAGKSSVFANIIHNKANAAEARMVDIIMPTDDRNWGARPTPVPELADMKADGGIFIDDNGQQMDAAVKADEIVAEAKKRANAMEKEIDDQLTEANYQSVYRDVIHDGVVIGTGIFKGPVVVGRTRKSWITQDGVSMLQMVKEHRPGCARVSPWDFFPDPNARRMDDCEDVFERKLINKKQMRALAKNPGYLVDQIAALVAEGPQKTTSYARLDMMREITEAGPIDYSGLYEVWEYHGAVEREDLIAAGMQEEDLPDDPLEEHSAIVVFCNSRVLRASLNPLETGEFPYSTWSWENDETSIFGFGVPYRGKDSQDVINAAWRMIMDNSGLSVGPQIVMHPEFVVPADGRQEITGRKLWLMTDRNKTVRDVFGLFEISGHQEELANIFNMARQLADEETNLPLIAQGEQSKNITDTFQGMGLLMQAATVVFRKAVRSWDDNITVKTIRRYYDWNMQNSKKQEIKGDFEIQARGVAYLSELEYMDKGIQDLVAMAVSPIFMPRTNIEELYKRVCKAKKIDPEGLVIPDADIQQPEDQGPPPEVQLEMAKLDIEKERLQLDREKAEAELQLKYEIEMAKIAAGNDMTARDMQIKLGLEERKFWLENKKIDTQREIAGVNALNVQNELTFKAQTGRMGI